MVRRLRTTANPERSRRRSLHSILRLFVTSFQTAAKRIDREDDRRRYRIEPLLFRTRAPTINVWIIVAMKNQRCPNFGLFGLILKG